MTHKKFYYLPSLVNIGKNGSRWWKLNRELYRKSSVCRAKERTHFSHEQLLYTDTGKNSNANIRHSIFSCSLNKSSRYTHYPLEWTYPRIFTLPPRKMCNTGLLWPPLNHSLRSWFKARTFEVIWRPEEAGITHFLRR